LFLTNFTSIEDVYLIWEYFKKFHALINYVVTILEHASTMFLNLYFSYVGMQTIYELVIVKDEG
jgi:hypothetical protein